MSASPSTPAGFRPNVAAILVNREGLIFIGERAHMPGAWQFPQGGLDRGESPVDGLARELREEISLEPADYLVEESHGPYRYAFPPGVTKKGYSGQEQTYFRLRLLADERRIDINTKKPEFRALRWIEPADFKLDWLPPMKRAVYQQVFQDFFALKLSDPGGVV